MSNPFNTNLSSSPQGGSIGYVVGSFNELGSPIKEGKFSADSGSVTALATAYNKHAERVGEYNPDILVNKSKRKAVKKAKAKSRAVKKYEDTEEPFPFFDMDIPEVRGVDPLEEIQRKNEEEHFNITTERVHPAKGGKKVQFSNNFGSIKVSAESVMKCDITINLIFFRVTQPISS